MKKWTADVPAGTLIHHFRISGGDNSINSLLKTYDLARPWISHDFAISTFIVRRISKSTRDWAGAGFGIFVIFGIFGGREIAENDEYAESLLFLPGVVFDCPIHFSSESKK